MTRVEAGIGVDDPDDGTGECVFAIAEGFDEDFAKVEREVGVTVGGKALPEAGGRGYGGLEVIVGWNRGLGRDQVLGPIFFWM